MNVFSFIRRRVALRQRGVLGMNERNHSYIARYNPRELFPSVDNKLTSKKLAIEYGVAVPKLIDVVETQKDISRLKSKLDKLKDGFVIKPAKGSGGKGILVIVGKKDDYYVKSSGNLIEFSFIDRHLSNILGGLYSLGGNTDVGMVEDLVIADPVFHRYTISGVPDIRTIIFQGFPIMSMLRLATEKSDGKANLHQGAVGVGLDIATGKSLRAVQFDLPVTKHPDTEARFDGLAIPNWQEVLELAASCYDMTGLGYLGVDIVQDKRYGPLILELNARPGLAIQIANGAGLLPRLREIEQLSGVETDLSVMQRVTYSKKYFGQSELLTDT